jgi:hypothetical protein
MREDAEAFLDRLNKYIAARKRAIIFSRNKDRYTITSSNRGEIRQLIHYELVEKAKDQYHNMRKQTMGIIAIFIILDIFTLTAFAIDKNTILITALVLPLSILGILSVLIITKKEFSLYQELEEKASSLSGDGQETPSRC